MAYDTRRLKTFRWLDSKAVSKAFKLLEVNRINPNIYTRGEKIELVGHNDDVSIKVSIMGMR